MNNTAEEMTMYFFAFGIEMIKVKLQFFCGTFHVSWNLRKISEKQIWPKFLLKLDSFEKFHSDLLYF